MRAMVTGASGFVGKHLVRHLLDFSDELSLFDHRAGAVEGVAVQAADVREADEMRRAVLEVRPDAIYHLAGMAFSPDADRDFSSALLTNVGGTYAVCQAASEAPHPITVLAVSSSEVYGEVRPEELPISETTPLRPTHNYGLSKAMAELACHRFEGRGQLNVVIARAFNHIGPGQRPDFVVPNFARQLAEISIGKREPVLQVGNLSPERDFTDVRDIVRGYRLAVTRGKGIYNFCSGTAVAIQTVLDELLQIAALEVEIRRDPSRLRAAENPCLCGSFAKARTELDWEPLIARELSLREIYECALKDLS